MKLAYFYLTDQGKQLAERLTAVYPGDLFGKEDFKKNMQQAFLQYDGLICIMATGIVVRTLAPLFVHKKEDAAVVVMDSKGAFAISLLSGHLGGANELAKRMAEVSGGQPVITTATDVEGAFAFDLFAKKHHMEIENIDQLKYISSALLRGEPVRICGHREMDELKQKQLLPYEEDTKDPVVVIDERNYKLTQEHVLYLRPKNIYIGLGFKLGKEGSAMIEAIEMTLSRYGYSEKSIAGLATIPKKAVEDGIQEAAKHFGTEIIVVDPEEINQLDFDKIKIKQSDFVSQNVGVPSVSTASAYIASDYGDIIVDKDKFPGLTVAFSVKKR